ncbi:MAG: alpha/beta fold hydrolase [Enterobacterales bacterium]|nr:alpha/beta fold hydrolase [Enterobacterales bacterium]
MGKPAITTSQQLVLLHGLGRSPRSMWIMQKAMQDKGYNTINLNYSPMTQDIHELATQLAQKIINWVNPRQPLHFVGHSFGGILIRAILAHPLFDPYPAKLGRCVMLGTPNQGTETASYALSHPIFKHFTPKIANHLKPDSHFIAHLPEPKIATGIIAGDKDFHVIIPVTWFYQQATKGAPGDGVVEISNTRCRNMSDFIILPLHHSFMMWNSQVMQQVDYFLGHGQFMMSEYRQNDK